MRLWAVAKGLRFPVPLTESITPGNNKLAQTFRNIFTILFTECGKLIKLYIRKRFLIFTSLVYLFRFDLPKRKFFANSLHPARRWT